MSWHFRYTCSGDLQVKIVDFLTRKCGAYIICREYGDQNGNEHIQAYLEFEVTKKHFMETLNKKFPNPNRRDKYLEPDKGETKQYVCKGESYGTLPVVLGKRKFDQEDITMYHELYWKKNNQSRNGNKDISKIFLKIEEKSQVETLDESGLLIWNQIKNLPLDNKKVKKKQKTMMRVVRDECIQIKGEDHTWSMIDKYFVFHRTLKTLGDFCKSLDHIILNRMVLGILNSLIKEDKEWYLYWWTKCYPDDDVPPQLLKNKTFLAEIDL